MKNYGFILLVFVSLLFSCKKEEETHRIKYQINFLEIPSFGTSNYIEVFALPSYMGEYNNSVNQHGNPIQPNVTYDQTKDGLWEYEYWELKNGDRIEFSLLAQLDYHYELRVFIDDVEVSYKRVKVHDSEYFAIEEMVTGGLDDTPSDPVIDFVFYD